MRKQLKKYVALTLISAALFTGCGSMQSDGTTSNNTSSSTSTNKDSSDTTNNISSTDSSNSSTSINETPTATSKGTTLSTSQVVIDKEFSNRDLDSSYEDSSANHITFTGTTINADSQNGISINGSILTITKEGTYVISGTLNEGQLIVDADDSAKIQLVLNGVDVTCSNNAPIYIKTADKVFITLAAGSNNSLTDGSEYTQSDDTNVDGVIFSKADLTLNGEGSLTINGNYKHGIASKDDLVITSGTYTITAVKDGLNGKDSVKIKDGTLQISVTNGNGIQSKNDEDTSKGYVYICGGTLNINKSQEGIEGTVILIEDGIVDIIAQDDGINATSGSSTATTSSANTAALATFTSTSGTTSTNSDLNVTSNTTLVNTASANSTTPYNRENRNGFGGNGGGEFANDANALLSITGGAITVDASGDGIDSNGSILISGGTIIVNGPTNSGNGGLDYNGTAEITGGTIFVSGSSGMAQGFSATSTQYSILYNFSSINEAVTKITLTDSDGNTIYSYAPTKQFQSVVISTPELKKGSTYTLTNGSQSEEITLSSVVTSAGEQMVGGPGGGGQGGRGMKNFQNGGTAPGFRDSMGNSDSSGSSSSNMN